MSDKRREWATREIWIRWLKGYDPGELFDSIIRNCQGAESRCQYCGEPIRFDITEGGGVPDWGNSGDYGCPDSPDTGDEGTGGHLPVGVERAAGPTCGCGRRETTDEHHSRESAAGGPYTCAGCGRAEEECSADPCAFVIAEREA